MAYADQKLISWNRSTGGYEGENGHSYTATVLHAAKSLSQSLRDLSGSVANSFTGVHNSNSSHNISVANDSNQMSPGIITIIDIKVRHFIKSVVVGINNNKKFKLFIFFSLLSLLTI